MDRKGWRHGVYAGLVLTALFVVAGQLSTLLTAGAADTDGLVGQELIDTLGLKPEESPLVGCDFAAEADGKLFCLENHVSNGSELRLLAMRLRGRMPTPLDRQLVALFGEIDALEASSPSGDIPGRRLFEITQQIRELMEAGARAN